MSLLDAVDGVNFVYLDTAEVESVAHKGALGHSITIPNGAVELINDERGVVFDFKASPAQVIEYWRGQECCPTDCSRFIDFVVQANTPFADPNTGEPTFVLATDEQKPLLYAHSRHNVAILTYDEVTMAEICKSTASGTVWLVEDGDLWLGLCRQGALRKTVRDWHDIMNEEVRDDIDNFDELQARGCFSYESRRLVCLNSGQVLVLQ